MYEHRKLLIAICFTSFLTALMSSSLNIALPFIAQDYNVSSENATWMINAFTATTASFLLASSALSDRIGYLKIFVCGVVLSVFFSLAIAIAPNLFVGAFFRAMQGVSFAMIFCTSTALASQRIPPEQRSYAIAYIVASVYGGLTCSPVLAGFIVDSLGWQVIFYATALGLAACYVLCKGEEYDKPLTDSMQLGRMFFSFIIGLAFFFSLSYYTTDERAIWVLYASILATAIYLYVEYKNKNPLLPVKFILSNKIMLYAVSASMLHYFASFVYTLLLAMHLQLILGYSASHVGLILLVQPFFMVVFSVVSGKLAHIIGPQYLTLIGIICCLVSIVMLLGLEPNSSLTLIFSSQVVMGIGFGLFSAPNTLIIMNSVEPKFFALASAVLSLARTIGQAISMACLTAMMHNIITAKEGTTLYIRELSYAIHNSYVLSAFVFLGALAGCFGSLIYRHREVLKQKRAERDKDLATIQVIQERENQTQAAKEPSAQQEQVKADKRDAANK